MGKFFEGKLSKGIIGNLAAARPDKNVAVILYENKLQSVEFTCPSEDTGHTIEGSFPACLACPKLYQSITNAALNLKEGFILVDVYSKNLTRK